jgi:hypothetical protein
MAVSIAWLYLRTLIFFICLSVSTTAATFFFFAIRRRRAAVQHKGHFLHWHSCRRSLTLSQLCVGDDLLLRYAHLDLRRAWLREHDFPARFSLDVVGRTFTCRRLRPWTERYSVIHGML